MFLMKMEISFNEVFFMKYRCPYCGEPAFTTAERIGIPTSIGKYAAFFPTCPRCKRTAHRTSSVGPWCSLSLCLILLAAVTLPLLRWTFTAQGPFVGAVAVASLLLFAGGYCAIYYYLFHFDKSASEIADDTRFAIAVAERRRPPLRVGEIYVCRFPQRDTGNAPQIIALVHRMQKAENGYTLEMRVIRADNMDLPVANERVRLITDSRYDIEGKVTWIPS